MPDINDAKGPGPQFLVPSLGSANNNSPTSISPVHSAVALTAIASTIKTATVLGFAISAVAKPSPAVPVAAWTCSCAKTTGTSNAPHRKSSVTSASQNQPTTNQKCPSYILQRRFRRSRF